jgi:hypothetical protein
MSNFAPSTPAKSASDAVLPPHVEKIVDALRKLWSALPVDEQERLLGELSRSLRLIPASRAGEVLGEIVRLIPRREEFSVQDIKKRISDRGITAAPKAVYNALSYLKSTGQVKSVGYGRYIVAGVGLHTAEDLGVAPSRNEDESSGF